MDVDGARGRRGARLPPLAILGGPRAFAEPLHVGEPNVGDRDRLIERIGGILDRCRLTNTGPSCRSSRRWWPRSSGCGTASRCATGRWSCRSPSVPPGSAATRSSLSSTFVATAHALRWQGISPVFCDIERRTQNLDPLRVEKAITASTTGIVGMHLWGRPCAIDELTDLADRRGLVLLFDAAHAFGCSHRGQMIGRFGTAEVLSFHATKFVNSFEGARS